LSARTAAAPALRSFLAVAIVSACESEIRAPKPGNVSVFAPGHGMSAEQFLLSAQAIAPPLTTPGLRVGERILAAIEATAKVVSCNTNLGIVLLCAPLAQAALQGPSDVSLQVRLQQVLLDLDVRDAESAYASIRLANPGGLGASARHDVRDAPRVSLLDAMRAAQGHDSIARQYACGYADIFNFGIPRLRAALERWQREEWAVVATYLEFLSRWPDSLILRKYGMATASRVQAAAKIWDLKWMEAVQPAELIPELLSWDAELKADRLNPGTSADLTVATLLAARLLDPDCFSRLPISEPHDIRLR
jgi:triphosphoribosyl-dephospho-CoA synthase